MMICIMVTVSIGCGTEPVTKNSNETEAFNENEDTSTIDVMIEENTSRVEFQNTEDVTESSTSETEELKEDSISISPEEVDEKLNLVEYKDSFEDIEYRPENHKRIIPLDKFEDYNEKVTLKDSINIYFDENICIGYTKPNLDIQIISKWNDWCLLLDVSNKSVLVKYSEIQEAKVDIPEKAVVSSTKTETTSSSVESTPSVETPQTSVPEVSIEIPENSIVETPVESDKYTPEEAIAVYRSILEGAGITWDPSIKEFASWGTGFMYLDKDYIEEAGQSDVEAMQFMGAIHYYLEVTGSDEECVYITMYHST